jgi:hypothetical protein
VNAIGTSSAMGLVTPLTASIIHESNVACDVEQ